MFPEYTWLPAILLLSGASMWHFLKFGAWKFTKFKFSVRNYYLMMSPYIVGLLIFAWQANSVRPLVVFLILAITGVIGETLSSIWWQFFYGQRLWVYTTETLYHRYTSS